MSLVKTIGKQNVLILQPDQSVSMAPDGSGEGRLSYKCTWDKVSKYVPVPLQPHPDFPALLLYEFNTVREPGDIGRFDCIYRGVLAPDTLALKQEEVTMSTSAEPIESHPRYAGVRDKDGHWPDPQPVSTSDLAAINLALQNNALNFTSTNALAVELFGKKIRGIDSYLRVGTTYRANYVLSNPPTADDYASVGKIPTNEYVAKFSANAPVPPTGSNYLYTDLSWRKAGGAFYISIGLQLSGTGGWDTIYKP